MQENIKQGKTDLLTYQQAIGGSVIQSLGEVLSENDYEEEEMPEMSKKDDVKIVVPSFAKILSSSQTRSMSERNVNFLRQIPSLKKEAATDMLEFNRRENLTCQTVLEVTISG